MSYRLIRHPEIERDLDDIALLIAEYAGLETAYRKITEIETSIAAFAETPHKGSVRDEIFPNLRAIPTARKGVLSFVVDDESQTVFIVSVTYAGADWIGKMPRRFLDK